MWCTALQNHSTWCWNWTHLGSKWMGKGRFLGIFGKQQALKLRWCCMADCFKGDCLDLKLTFDLWLREHRPLVFIQLSSTVAFVFLQLCLKPIVHISSPYLIYVPCILGSPSTSVALWRPRVAISHCRCTVADSRKLCMSDHKLQV